MLCTKDTAKAVGLNIWVNGEHNNKEPEVDIIAVQGLGAHPYYTWVKKEDLAQQKKSSKLHLHRLFSKQRAPAQELGDAPQSTSDRSEVMWLRDLLPSLISSARIASFSYESDWRNDVKTNLRSCGEQLLNILHQNRVTNAERRRPLIIIGHSLGGLVVKQALVLTNHRDIFKDIKFAIAGIVFLGTPHQGSSAAESGIWLSRAFRNDTTLIETLKKNSSTLLKVAQDFETSYSDTDIVYFYEMKDGPLGSQFVDHQFAPLNAKRKVYLNTDHSGLNKYFGFDDENFVQVQTEICRMFQAAPQSIERRYRSIMGEGLAISVTPDGHSETPRWLNNLGTTLSDRYNLAGDIGDLDAAISKAEQGVSTTPKDHPELAGRLNILANMLFDRYNRTGNMNDLEAAIFKAELLVSTTPKGHPDQAEWLNSLGIKLLSRYNRTGNIDDLQAAISTAKLGGLKYS